MITEIERILKDATPEHEFTLSYNELLGIAEQLRELQQLKEKYRLLLASKK